MIEGHVWLDRIKTAEEFNELVEKSKSDNHGVYAPTHIVKKNGEVLGYFSIAASVPIVLAWLSTQKVQPRDSISLINSVENHVAMGGASHVAFPVPKSSPFHEHMEKLGYKPAGEYTFFIKEL